MYLNYSETRVMTKYDIITHLYCVFFLVNRSPIVPNVPVGGPTSVGFVTVRRGGPGRSVIVTREEPRRRPVVQRQGRVIYYYVRYKKNENRLGLQLKYRHLLCIILQFIRFTVLHIYRIVFGVRFIIFYFQTCKLSSFVWL